MADDAMIGGLLDGLIDEAMSDPATREHWEKEAALRFPDAFRSSPAAEEGGLAPEEGGSSSEQLKDAGNAAFAQKDYALAIEKYTAALERDAANHLLLSNRAAAKLGGGDAAGAAEDARACIDRAPEFVKGYNRLATAQLALGDGDAALATTARGLERDPSNEPLRILKRRAKRTCAEAAAVSKVSDGATRKDWTS